VLCATSAQLDGKRPEKKEEENPYEILMNGLLDAGLVLSFS
jgi:hypothetical protein